MPEETPAETPSQTPEVEPVKPPRRWSWDAFLSGVFLGGIALCAGLFLPVINVGRRDARRAEGEQMLGAMRDAARVKHAQSDGTHVTTVSGAMGPGDFGGEYCVVLSVVSYLGNDENAAYAIAKEHGQPVVKLTFSMESGNSHFERIGPFAHVGDP